MSVRVLPRGTRSEAAKDFESAPRTTAGNAVTEAPAEKTARSRNSRRGIWLMGLSFNTLSVYTAQLQQYAMILAKAVLNQVGMLGLSGSGQKDAA